MSFAPNPFALLQVVDPNALSGESAARVFDNGVAFPWIPVLLLVVPAVVAVGLIVMYLRTIRRMRQAQLAPPVWLLPYLEHTEHGPPVWPPTQSSEEVTAELAERAESVDRLARRKRAILVGLALNFVAGWAMAGAYLYESRRTIEYQDLPGVPSLNFSVDTTTGVALADGPVVTAEPPPPAAPVPLLDTAEARRRNEQRLAFFRRRDSLALLAIQDSVAMVALEAQRLRDSVAQAATDSIARATLALAPVPPRATLPPPPPPPAPPPPDPAVELARATDVLNTAARGLVARIGAGQSAGATLAAAPRQQLDEFVLDNRPTAALGAVSAPVVQGARAEATVELLLQWRGAFGDTRRRTVRFRAEAVRRTTGWEVTGLTPLDDLP